MTLARIIADSVSAKGDRLTTMEVVMHRFVLAEFNTHRKFSRNSASSRAIPVHKQMQKISDNLAYPVEWPEEQKGMQGGEILPDHIAASAELVWKAAANVALVHAQSLVNLGVHKSVTNRLLEPFMWHTVVVTSTEWENFFDLRCSLLAQPEIRAAAEIMRDLYRSSIPTLVDYGQWHLPYVNEADRLEAIDRGYRPCHISAARSCRVSYLTQDGVRDQQEDQGMYDRLITADPEHASPLEHPATPCTCVGNNHKGNFDGWDQLRHYRDM